MKVKVGIIGCGNMGQALLGAIIAKNYASRRNILCCDKDRNKLKALRSRFKVRTSASSSEVVQKCGLIILAVKPQDIDAVSKDLTFALKGKLIISICAGVTTKKLQRYLGKVSIVRVMPNMPAQISQGISAVSLGKYARKKDRRLAFSIFSCVGEVIEVREDLMDAVTAISGCGPAYFFYLVEKLIDTAKELGVSSHSAQRLAIKTALGSAMLMDQSTLTPQALRKKVSSRKGATEAAFSVFKKKRLGQVLTLGFKAAAKRSKQLQR